MAAYYLDTSALVKRYAREQGTAWVTQLAHTAAGHELFTVRVAGPELIAALFRKARTGGLTLAEASQAASTIRRHWRQRYRIIGVSVGVADRAMSLAERHSLRGYDAVHVAAALEVHDARRAAQLSALTFVTADAEQLQVAAAEGLLVDNPNNYP